MSHHYETRGCAGPTGSQDVLTVHQDADYVNIDAVFSFQPDAIKAGGPTTGRLVVRLVDNETSRARDYLQAVVAGEDLWAFRELLNQMPESAFVEPAPSKVVWVDGDVIEQHRPSNDCRWMWVRVNGAWEGVAIAGLQPTAPKPDQEIDHLLSLEQRSDMDVYTVKRRGGKRP